jgi:hypothetical protein
MCRYGGIIDARRLAIASLTRVPRSLRNTPTGRKGLTDHLLQECGPTETHLAHRVDSGVDPTAVSVGLRTPGRFIIPQLGGEA